MTTPKSTSHITFGDNTTIQMSKAGSTDFSDALPLDDLSGVGTGPFLVLDRGIWKYPTQPAGGRIEIPTYVGRPVRLVNMMADFGASIPVTVTIAQGALNTSGEPYAAADEALYRTGSIVIYSATTRYAAVNLDIKVAESASIIWPGQKVFVVTTGAVNPIVRLTFTAVNSGD